MDKKDKYIKAKLQQDKAISNQAKEIFENFEGRIKMENNNEPKQERKVLKISLNQAILAFVSLIIVFILGGNLYAHLNGKPNIYSAIKGLFVKEENYKSSEITVDQTVENNGIKLTLKTVAMDENILITKYVAEGEKLAKEFYTYTEFEEDMIEYESMLFSLVGEELGEEYEKVTQEDANNKKANIQSELEKVGLTSAEAKSLIDYGQGAFGTYIGAELGLENCSTEEAKELIAEVIAMFESKVSSKYEIMTSDVRLQNFGIEVISQKIEKSGNQYIIYNLYTVDTITDLANKFNLNINVTKVGSTEGTWNFSTELEKARLDTRVETIDFYQNNSNNNVAPNIVSGGARHNATVTAKRLVISDLSSVLMIQTKVDEDSSSTYFKYGDNGLPCIFVVTDEDGNVVGTGTCSTHDYEIAVSAGDRILYTDRIILENVDKDTKKLYVKIYEQYETVEYNSTTIELDIEAARQGNHIELNQTLYNARHGISLQYPGSWTQPEKVSVDQEVILHSPADIDGNKAHISMERVLVKDIESGKFGLADPENEFKDVVKTTIEVSDYIGDDYVYTYGEETKGRQIRVVKDDAMYIISYSGSLTQFERYSQTFEEILKTVIFVEVKEEKSYTAYYTDNSSDSLETVKVYDDGTVTVQISENAKEIFGKDIWEAVIEAKKEYKISGVSNVCKVLFLNAVEGGTYVGSYIFFIGQEITDMCLLDMNKAIKTGDFVANRVDINFWITDFPYIKETRVDGYEKLLVVVPNDYGDEYVISRDGTVEKYVAPEQPENNNQELNSTDELAIEVIQKYLDIEAAYNAGALYLICESGVLDLGAKVDFDDSFTENNKEYVYTGVEYKRFYNEMLKYMSEAHFNTFNIAYRNLENKLYASNGGASGYKYLVDSVHLNLESEGVYYYKVNLRLYELGMDVQRLTWEFDLEKVNGNLIVQNISKP